MLAQWCQACCMILHSYSQLHPTVLNKLNYSLLDLAPTSPIMASRICDKAVAGRAQCPHNSDDLLEMVVRECMDFPKAPSKYLILHLLPPFAIQVAVIRYAH